ncbi:MAG: hypothetical protein C5B50_14685 [Verrucomicrobia bacterium]|nr:MAG: hypothetical protein C5B50_14685 [Verrucomicrobiota bacterium]
MRFPLFALLIAASLRDFTAGAQEAATSEYQVEAAYLYHFAEFVAWPPAAFSGPDSPVVIGVLNADPLAAELEAIIRNKTVQGRGLRMMRLDSRPITDARACHILFTGNSDQKRLAELLSGLKGAPVLTVGKMEGFTAAGGVINFLIEDKKVKFEINDAAARQVGLRISAKLLNLARRKTAALAPRPTVLAACTLSGGVSRLLLACNKFRGKRFVAAILTPSIQP